jgi:hypothetical protein
MTLRPTSAASSAAVMPAIPPPTTKIVLSFFSMLIAIPLRNQKKGGKTPRGNIRRMNFTVNARPDFYRTRANQTERTARLIVKSDTAYNEDQSFQLQ